MADITMCKGDDCPMASVCHRTTAKKGIRQSFFEYPPFEEEVDTATGVATYTCKHYWHNGKQA